jgi:hypothetical protein
MANSKSTRTRARKSPTDQPPTVAQRNRAIRQLRKSGGAHVPRPPNFLIQDTPAQTIERCKRVVNWLAHISQPLRGGDLDAAEADVLHTVVDALEHAERVVRSIGAQADLEVAHA